MSARRAWFIRGDNDHGVNRISTWVSKGYVSIGWRDSSLAEVGMSREELKHAISGAEPDFDQDRVAGGAGNLERFLNDLSVGDIVVTKDHGKRAVYAGIVTGSAEKLGSTEEGAVWQRAVSWADTGSPFDLDALADPLRVFLNARGPTIRDFSSNLDDLEELLGTSGTGDGWTQFLYWAERIWNLPTFDAEERDYKLEAARVLAEARRALAPGGEWLTPLKAGLGGQNNLVDWRARASFIDWCTADPDAAARALGALWNADEITADTIDTFARDVTSENSTGNKLTVASVLLMGLDYRRYPAFRAMVDENVRKLVGIAKQVAPIAFEDDAVIEPNELAKRLGISGLAVRNHLRRTHPRSPEEHGDRWQLDAATARAVVEHFQQAPRNRAPGERYVAFLDLIDEFVERMAARGVELRDRLDGQSLFWWVSTAPAPEAWPEDERSAFLAFQKGKVTTVVVREPGLVAPVTDALASSLHLPRPWLQEAVDLLVDKRQVIFYGPPGTGKTFVARALGDHIVATGGAYRLVQFHPAYSYEDFFEGYRPSTSGDGSGGLHFNLQKGPLRRIAEEAAANPDTPYLLVIDEINRGNIAKIFGELYFLLEYRDQPIRLQYSPDAPFQLPENLLLIGTMNTADRSIALVDSALRRRFYFYPFLPRELPVRDVLVKWLAAEGYDSEPAHLLRALNEALHDALPDDEFAIGPSYLMPKSGPPDLDRVWRYAIRPLLEERFYGSLSVEEIEREFGLAAMRRRLAGVDIDGGAVEDGAA